MFSECIVYVIRSVNDMRRNEHFISRSHVPSIVSSNATHATDFTLVCGTIILRKDCTETDET